MWDPLLAAKARHNGSIVNFGKEAIQLISTLHFVLHESTTKGVRRELVKYYMEGDF